MDFYRFRKASKSRVWESKDKDWTEDSSVQGNSKLGITPDFIL